MLIIASTFATTRANNAAVATELLGIGLGAYTIVGFESASNLAEETQEPRAVVPKAMLRAVFLSGIVGFAFMEALS